VSRLLDEVAAGLRNVTCGRCRRVACLSLSLDHRAAAVVYSFGPGPDRAGRVKTVLKPPQPLGRTAALRRLPAHIDESESSTQRSVWSRNAHTWM
jgi:hypothetical protein